MKVNTVLDAFTAELTRATYVVALRCGIEGSWMDLELDLWKVLSEKVQKWRQERPPALSPGESETRWEGLLSNLADAAYHTALPYGEWGSVVKSQSRLYQALRSAIGDTIRGFRKVCA